MNAASLSHPSDDVTDKHVSHRTARFTQERKRQDLKDVREMYEIFKRFTRFEVEFTYFLEDFWDFH